MTPRIRLVTLLLVGTATTGGLAHPALAQPTTPPPPMDERTIAFPPFQELTLENGLRVVVLPYGTQPVLSAHLYVQGGQAAEPPELAGLAQLTATVLTRGTETRSAPEISGLIEGVGGSLSASAGQDFVTVSTTVLTDHAETAFELLGDVVLRATFPGDEVELARRQTLSALQAELGQPQAIAQRRFAAVVYGADHPYGVWPTPTTVNAVTRDDMVRFRDRVLQPGDALLLVAGQVDRDEIEALARHHLGGWEGAAPPAASVPEPSWRGDTRIFLVHRPGSVQSVIALGHPGLVPGDPDYFPVLVMNRVLGGGGDARLFRILREEKGWTYGASSQFTRPAHRGVFRAVTEVRTEVTDSALVEVLHQMRRLRDEPVPAEELDAARNFLAGSFPLRLETPDQVAAQLATALLLDLPMDEITRYPERVRQVEEQDIRRVAAEHLRPGHAAVVVVGDGPRILESLEAVAPVEIFDVEGSPLDRGDLLARAAPASWDGTRLEEGVRRYDIYVQGSPMGSAEYRLERDGDDWVSTTAMAAVGSQETRLRFAVDDLAPRSLEIRGDPGPGGMSARLEVTDGRVRGELELPPQLGGAREVDRELPEGLLLAGMDEYALAVAELAEGAVVTVPYLNLLDEELVTLEARVTGREEISVPAGTFDTWRVELSGGDAPMILYLRVEAPHVLIRQEYQGQPVRLDLTSMGPL